MTAIGNDAKTVAPVLIYFLIPESLETFTEALPNPPGGPQRQPPSNTRYQRRPSPFIATALFAAYHSSLPIALYMVACAIIGIVATALLTDYTNRDISAEYEHV